MEQLDFGLGKLPGDAAATVPNSLSDRPNPEKPDTPEPKRRLLQKPVFDRPLSHSSMSTYESCPARFKFKYIDRLPEKPRHYFSFGKSVHAGLEFLFLKTTGPIPSLEDLLAFYKREWIREGYESSIQERDYFLEGERILKGFYEKHQGDFRRPMFVEYKFNIKVDGIRVTGVVDRIDKTESGRLHIIDYKTGKAFDKSRVKEDPQISLYQFALTQLLGLEVESVTLYHLNSLTPLTAPPHSSILLDRVVERVRQASEGIQSGRFDPAPDESGQCRFCDFKPICPAFANGSGAAATRKAEIPSAQAVESAVDRYVELSQKIHEIEKELKSLRPILEDYSRRKGYSRLAGKAHELLCQKQETWKFDPDAAKAILEPAGLWEEVLKYDPRGVDRLIREGAIPIDLKEKLKKLGELIESFKITPKISQESA